MSRGRAQQRRAFLPAPSGPRRVEFIDGSASIDRLADHAGGRPDWIDSGAWRRLGCGEYRRGAGFNFDLHRVGVLQILPWR